VGLRPLADWNWGFESRRGRRCMSVVSVVCCQVEVSASVRSLVQRIPTDCSVSSECDRETPKAGGGGNDPELGGTAPGRGGGGKFKI